MTLPSRLRRAMALPEWSFRQEWLNELTINEAEGAYRYWLRTKSVDEALVKCVEALQCNETFHSLGGIDDCEPCKALAELEKAVKQMEGE